jgi:type 1 fimbriae regulatory protein FimB/type 1 fimbriae regulatory protein FimE
MADLHIVPDPEKRQADETFGFSDGRPNVLPIAMPGPAEILEFKKTVKRVSRDEKPKVSSQRLYLRPDEANRLIAVAGQTGRYPFRDKVLVRLIYRHGLRVSEAANLRWDHLHLEGGTVDVKRSKRGNSGSHTMDRDELRDLRKLRKMVSGPYVFETERGSKMSTDVIWRIVRRSGDAAKLDVRAHPHMLRHAAGYFLINNDVDVRLVQSFLGHKSISTTAHYTALAPGRLAGVRVR